jgi:hypothetical protein
MRGRLAKAMYGTRDAAFNWECEYVEFMKGVGFNQGRANPCIFYHPGERVRAVVHGDDFTVGGFAAELDWFREMIVTKFEVKFKARLGEGEGDDKGVECLNRVMEWVDHEGVRYEADQRHAEIIVRELGLEEREQGSEDPGSQGGVWGAVPISVRRSIEHLWLVPTTWRRTGEISSSQSKSCAARCPSRQGGLGSSEATGRISLGEPRKVLKYPFQRMPREIVIWSDTDRAGCRETRKSTTGGVGVLGEHCLKSWSSTQDVIALSSGEAEFYGIVRGAAQGLGMRSMLGAMGIEVEACGEHGQPVQAKGIAVRKGLGRVRHDRRQSAVDSRLCGERGDPTCQGRQRETTLLMF